jgi:hypothetical protein
MKLVPLISEKYGKLSNAGREFGEKYIRDFINPGKLAELWTAFEATYPKLKPQLQSTFEKTNDLFKYIKPEKGGESYRVSTLPEAAAQELNEYLDDTLIAIDELSNLNEPPTEKLVLKAIQYFDGLFQDMLNIFTSNTAGDAPLEPYKTTNIGFGSPQYVREIIKKSLNELEGESINYTKFFQEIIKKLQQLDVSIDYLSSTMTGKSPWDIGVDQDSVGRLTTPTKQKNQPKKS